jgi:hypothetical protein
MALTSDAAGWAHRVTLRELATAELLNGLILDAGEKAFWRDPPTRQLE